MSCHISAVMSCHATGGRVSAVRTDCTIRRLIIFQKSENQKQLHVDTAAETQQNHEPKKYTQIQQQRHNTITSSKMLKRGELLSQVQSNRIMHMYI